MERLELHDRSLDEAKHEFDAAFDRYVDDPAIGALLVNHGYGKDKGRPVIKEWIAERTKRLRNHKRVRRVISGEQIADPFDEKAKIIRHAVADLDFSQIGINNPGITIIVFNRE